MLFLWKGRDQTGLYILLALSVGRKNSCVCEKSCYRRQNRERQFSPDTLFLNGLFRKIEQCLTIVHVLELCSLRNKPINFFMLKFI